MSRDWFSIGATPAEEPCEQVGTSGYDGNKARIECRIFKNMLERTLKPTISLGIKKHNHEAGGYLEVVCYFDDEVEAEVQEMLRLESEAPGKWDEEAQAELALELQRLQARYAASE
jgi:hypothetical protein